MKKILLLTLAAFLLVSCNNSNNKTTVKIGVIGPLTGTGATTSDYWVNGFKYAIDQINSKQDGETYELII